MLRFGEKKVTEERFCGQEKPTKIWDVNVKTFKVKDEGKDKDNKLMSFSMRDESD